MRNSPAGATPLVRRHWLFLVVLAGAVLVRVLVAIPYWPALLYVGDSFAYLTQAIDREWGQTQPNGYPTILEALFLPGRSLATVAIAQHLAGLAIGVLTYVALLRLRVNRYLAALAAALVLLNSFAVVLEQHVLTETFFTLELAGAAFLAVTGVGARRSAASGLLFAAAGLTRVVGIVAVPVWLVYLAAKERTLRTVAVGAVAAILPLVAYAGAHAATGRGFRFTEWNGWILYGRVAHFADCRGVSLPSDERKVCETPAGRRLHVGWTPSDYIFRGDSPAERVFGYPSRNREANAVLRGFALDMIRAHPGAYARAVAADYSRYLRPGNGGVDPGVVLHEQDERDLSVYGDEPVMRRHFPGFDLKFRGPLHAAVWYGRHLRPWRPIFGLLALLALAAFVLGFSGRLRSRLPHWLETAFLGAVALAVSLAAVATTELNMRFFMPVVPLLACAGALALSELGALALTGLRSARERRAVAARLG